MIDCRGPLDIKCLTLNLGTPHRSQTYKLPVLKAYAIYIAINYIQF